MTQTATMLLREGKAAKVEKKPTEEHRCPLKRRPSLHLQDTRLNLHHMALSGGVDKQRMRHNAVLNRHQPTLADQLMMNRLFLSKLVYVNVSPNLFSICNIMKTCAMACRSPS